MLLQTVDYIALFSYGCILCKLDSLRMFYCALPTQNIVRVKIMLP